MMQKAISNYEVASPRILTPVVTDLLLLLLAAPALLFPDHLPRIVSAAGLLLLPLSFLLRYRQTGQFTRYAHTNWPALFLLIVLLPMAMLASPLPWAVTWPHVTIMAWSVWLYFVVLNWTGQIRANPRGRTRLTAPSAVYLVLGLVVAVIGTVGMRSVDKFLPFSLPDLIESATGLSAGLPTNEIAGVLTLFIPFSAALLFGSLRSKRTKLAAAMLVLTAIMGITLLLTQSRTGMAATAVVVVVAFFLILRPGRTWMLAMLALATVGLLLAVLTDAADPLIFAGANSWDSVIGPRQMVWQQGWQGALDFGLVGMGLGLFGRVVPLLYPQVPPGQAAILEDAHNLYLQTVQDLGWLGLLTLAALLLIALLGLVRMASRRSSRTLGYAWFVGLVAALVAHMLYSLTDAVALGTWAGIPLWFALGLSVAKTHNRLPSRAVWPHLALGGLLLTGLVLIAAVFLAPVNLAGRATSQALLTGEGTEEALARTAAGDGACVLHYQEGLLHNAWQATTARNAAWGKALSCSPRFTNFMAILAPDDQGLAAVAISARPDEAAGYFWLAGAVAGTRPDKSIDLYRQGLQLAPEHGESWLALAEQLEAAQPGAAMEAYLQACHHGDPGANGCWRAGQLAEASGDLAQAIGIYRLSHWEGAQARAAELELEQQLQP